MTTVYAGPDGAFWTGWQLARCTHYPFGWRWVLSYNGDLLLETSDGDPYLCVALREEDLPEGVYVDGAVVRDDRKPARTANRVEGGEGKR